MESLVSSKLKDADGFSSTDPLVPVKILKSDKEVDPIEPITVQELMEKVVNSYGDHPALVQKDLVSGKWVTVTYSEYKRRVEKMAKVFIKLGLKEHGSVAILANNCVEAFIAQLAANYAGGQALGIYTTNSPSICQYILEKSNTNIIVLDEDHQLRKILEVKENLPNLKAIIQTTPGKGEVEGVYKFSDLEGAEVDSFEDEYQRRLKNIAPNDCCFICFTSGTTGNPKGAMMSYDNLIWSARSINSKFKNLKMAEETIVSYLPLSHVAGQMMDIFWAINLAATVYFADKNALKGSLLGTLKEVRPTLFLGVPRIYEKIHEFWVASHSHVKGMRKIFFNLARNATANYHLKHTTPSFVYNILKNFIMNGVKAELGLDKIKYAVTGSAPISESTLEFFAGIDLPLLDAYGMTESSGLISFSMPGDCKLNSAGKIGDLYECNILNPDENGRGEIICRGRNVFMGYIGDIEKTLEAKDGDGWLHSGDIGHFDPDGFLFITGRIKELIITAGGENIPFILIENIVKSECSAVSNAFLIGDKRKFLSILLTIKTLPGKDGAPSDDFSNETIDWFNERNLKFTKVSEMFDKSGKLNEKVFQEFQKVLAAVNEKAISNAQKVQKFAILSNDFSQMTGEFGPTMKLKRSFVEEKYKKIIDKFYT